MKRHASLNRIYRLIWSAVHNCWIAVAETSSGRGKGGRRKLAGTVLMLSGALAQAAPTGGQIAGGNGSISQSGSTTTIKQNSQNLSLNWQSFNVGRQETVNFVQPSAAAIAVNRIYDTAGSQILGRVNANGQVWLINPNGVLFGQGAQVNVGGLVASTLDLSSTSGDGKTARFAGTSSASVVNEGTLTASSGGYVALIGPSVSNTGSINAPQGTVALGAGSTVTLNFSGNSLASLQVEQSLLDTLAANGGLIQVDGGQVLLSAGARDSLIASVVNNTGVIEARTVENHAGNIVLLAGMSAGTTQVGGTLDASAPTGGDGGFIETSGAKVKVTDSAHVTTAASTGQTGRWLIDPTDFTVAASGGDMTGAAVSSALASNNFTVQSSSGASGTAGNVNINDSVSWSANTLTLNASSNINLNAALNASGTAGLALQYGQGAVASGNTSTYNVNAPVNLASTGSFSTKLGSDGVVKNYTIITSLGQAGSTTGADLQGINGNLASNYVLGANIDASSTSTWNSGAGFAPLGTSSSKFTGSFDGLGHTVSGLTIKIDQWSTDGVGLFGSTGASGQILNVGMVGGSVIGALTVGGLVGMNGGSISNSYVTGSVNGFKTVGGLVGANTGSVSNSYTTGNVHGANSVGGLAGENFGNISNSYVTGSVSSTADGVGGLVALNSNSGTISNSYVTGSVSNQYWLSGGLVGENRGAISNSYVSGSVTGGSRYVGGLVGFNYGGSVSSSYASGSVTGTGTDLGGLVGANQGTVSNSYWNTTTTGQASSAGGTGLSDADWHTAAKFVGFNFTTTPGASGNNWVIVDGGSPLLASEYSTTIVNAHQLQLISLALGASYTLGADIDASATGTAGKDVWGSAGFAPIGSDLSSFTGSFNGQGHTVSGLTINRPNTDYVGLFGYTGTGSLIQNIGLLGGTVSGLQSVGGLVGENFGGSISNSYTTGSVTGLNFVGELVGGSSGSISNSYALGSVNGADCAAGGLVGDNRVNGIISNSYATGSITGSNRVGGLAGQNSGSISNSYATGIVTGQNGAGGLVGSNFNAITNSYATGKVSSADIAGGLAGGNNGSISSSYATGIVSVTDFGAGGLAGHNSGSISNSYSTGSVSGKDGVGGLVGYYNDGNGNGSISTSYATGSVLGTGSDIGGLVGYRDGGSISSSYWNIATTGQASSAGGSGLSSDAMKQSANFVGWDTTVWKFYDGYTAPLLKAFLTPLTVTLTSGTRVYDGSTTGLGVSYSSTPNANLLGAATSVASGKNVGVQTLEASGLYSNQQGYDISYVSGTLSITPANLTLSTSNVSKTYDGSTSASGAAALVTGGTLFAGDTLTGGSFAFTDKNAGTGKTVTVANVAVNDGNSGGNYVVSYVSNTTSTIIAKAISGAITATDKTYDGTSAAATNGTLSGILGDDKVSLSTSGAFADKNAGSGKTVTVSGSLTGTDAGNYSVTTNTATTASIDKAMLNVAYTGVNKAYDGNTSATVTTADDRIANDSLTINRSASFADKNAANAKTVTVSGVSLSGIDAGNYTVASTATTTADIAAKAITGSITATGKTYDGTTAATTNGSLSGVVTGDVVSLGTSGAFADKNAGMGKLVNVSASLSGTDAGNYTVTSNATTTADIAAKAITGSITAIGKTYDGTTAASTNGTLSGLVAGDSVALATTGAFANKNAGTGKLVNVSGSLSGTDAGNYTVTSNATTTADVAAKAITGSITAIGKTYDGTIAAATSGSLAGVLTGDSVALATTGAFADKNVGTGKTVNVSGSLSGADADNYSVTSNTTSTASITPATLTYTATPTTSTVGQSLDALLSGSITGFVAGESLGNATTGSALWTSVASTAQSPGQYAVTGSGLSARNYLFSQAASNATALTLQAGTLPSALIPLTTQMVSGLFNTPGTSSVSAQIASATQSGGSSLWTEGAQSEGGAQAGHSSAQTETLTVPLPAHGSAVGVGGSNALRVQDGGVRLPDNRLSFN